MLNSNSSLLFSYFIGLLDSQPAKVVICLMHINYTLQKSCCNYTERKKKIVLFFRSSEILMVITRFVFTVYLGVLFVSIIILVLLAYFILLPLKFESIERERQREIILIFRGIWKIIIINEIWID